MALSTVVDADVIVVMEEELLASAELYRSLVEALRIEPLAPVG